MELKVESLSKRYGGKTVLDGVSFPLREGVTCLMAPSGAGKTTLLRLLLGLEKADGGQITGLAGRRVGTVFQEDRLLPGMDAEGNLRFALGAEILAAGPAAAPSLPALRHELRPGPLLEGRGGRRGHRRGAGVVGRAALREQDLL